MAICMLPPGHITSTKFVTANIVWAPGRAWPGREAARQYERLVPRQAARDDALRRDPQPLRHRVAATLRFRAS